jgi:signal transduction protein with GAF and PtsI domain
MTALLRPSAPRRDQELVILRSIAETVASTLDLDDVLRRVIEMVGEVTRADACLIYLYEPERGELVLRASKTPHPRAIGRVALKIGEGITGWVARERKPVAIARDAAADPRFKFFNVLPEDRYQAFLSVPLVARDEVIGVINVQHRRPHIHRPRTVDLVRTIGEQVGAAVANARLHTALKRKIAQLQALSRVSLAVVSDRLLEETLRSLAAVTAGALEAEACAVLLADAAGGTLSPRALEGPLDHLRDAGPLAAVAGVLATVFREGRPALLEDTAAADPADPLAAAVRADGLRSVAAAPMAVKDRTNGVLCAFASAPRAFGEDELGLIATVARQAALAVENAKLFGETRAMQEALESRKVIERAKGVLMRRRGLTENEAFRLLQKRSMDQRVGMRVIAEAILLSEDLDAKELPPADRAG